MLIAFITFFLSMAFAGSCDPDEIYVREQWIKSYTRSDNLKVTAHMRRAHCREINRFNYFQDSTTQKFKNIKTNVKVWKSDEKRIIEEGLQQIPAWLKKYILSEILRADSDGTVNPASSIATTKTLIIYDVFFTQPNKTQILAHEIAHLTVLDLDEKELNEFVAASGWSLDRKRGIKIPPKALIIPDSYESILEDYANHIEMYHYNPEKLKKLNPSSYFVIEKIAKRRGHK